MGGNDHARAVGAAAQAGGPVWGGRGVHNHIPPRPWPGPPRAHLEVLVEADGHPIGQHPFYHRLRPAGAEKCFPRDPSVPLGPASSSRHPQHVHPGPGSPSERTHAAYSDPSARLLPIHPIPPRVDAKGTSRSSRILPPYLHCLHLSAGSPGTGVTPAPPHCPLRALSLIHI